MKAKQLVTIAIVTMLLIGGMAALGAAVPADQANEKATASDANAPENPGDAADERDDHAADGENESVEDDTPVSDGDSATESDQNETTVSADDVQDPENDLPAHVPGHVSQIHDTIGQYLDGEIDHLGHALSDLIGGDAAGAADENSTNTHDTVPTNASEAGVQVNGSDDTANSVGSVGPSDGLPEQVPDHVSDVHETIESFLSGSINDLGQALGDLLGGTATDETSD